MAKAGPKTKYNPERVQRIYDAIASGQTQEVACHIADIDSQTFANWLKRYSDFSEGIARAKREHEAKLVEIWQHAATKGYMLTTPKGVQEVAPDWRAAQALLRVRNREVYSERAEVELSGPIQVNVVKYADADG